MAALRPALPAVPDPRFWVESRRGAVAAGSPFRFPSPLIGRVEDWRQLLRRPGLAVTLRFR
jgi:hypothetical protein